MIAYKTIFNETLAAATDKNILYEDLIDALKKKLAKHQELETTYYGKYPFGNCFKEGVKQLTEWIQIRDLKKLFNTFTEYQDSAKELFDRTKGMEDFASKALSQIGEIQRFVRDNNENFKLLSADVKEKVKKINHFLTLEDPRNEFRHVRKAHEEVKKALD